MSHPWKDVANLGLDLHRLFVVRAPLTRRSIALAQIARQTRRNTVPWQLGSSANDRHHVIGCELLEKTLAVEAIARLRETVLLPDLPSRLPASGAGGAHLSCVTLSAEGTVVEESHALVTYGDDLLLSEKIHDRDFGHLREFSMGGDEVTAGVDFTPGAFEKLRHFVFTHALLSYRSRYTAPSREKNHQIH